MRVKLKTVHVTQLSIIINGHDCLSCNKFSGISLSIVGGSNQLDESCDPYQFCVTLSAPLSGADLTVMIAPSGFATATSEP